MNAYVLHVSNNIQMHIKIERLHIVEYILMNILHIKFEVSKVSFVVYKLAGHLAGHNLQVIIANTVQK